jgi:PhnB protein
MSQVSPVPARYGSITPYLVVPECAEAIEFYRRAFDAVEVTRLAMPDGSIGHAELKIGDSILMLASGSGQWPYTASLICLYVEDCDAVFNRAVEGGATILEEVTDKFYGDRAGSVQDPYGQRWSIMTHKEDLTPDEMQKRAANLKG